MTSEQRFWAKVDVGDPEDCWLWTAGTNRYGYGSFRPAATGHAYAHRFAYELLVGPIPEGKTIDHLCRNRACCNPAHLEAVTRGENVLRGEGPSAQHSRQTHCIQGHLLDGGNVYITPGRGVRQCVACRRERQRRYDRERAAA